MPRKPSATKPSRAVQLHILLTEDEQKAYLAAANAKGFSLSVWARIALNERAARDTKTQR